MTNPNRKMVIWSGRTYVIEFAEDGSLLNSLELDDLMVAMKPSITKIARKYNPRLHIDTDDLVQTLYVVTMELLREFKPERAKWSTFFCSYGTKRMLSAIRPFSAGYKLREYTESDLEGELTLEKLTRKKSHKRGERGNAD